MGLLGAYAWTQKKNADRSTIKQSSTRRTAAQQSPSMEPPVVFEPDYDPFMDTADSSDTPMIGVSTKERLKPADHQKEMFALMQGGQNLGNEHTQGIVSDSYLEYPQDIRPVPVSVPIGSIERAVINPSA